MVYNGNILYTSRIYLGYTEALSICDYFGGFFGDVTIPGRACLLQNRALSPGKPHDGREVQPGSSHSLCLTSIILGWACSTQNRAFSPLAIGWLLRAALMLAPLAGHEIHHPLRLVLSAVLAPPPWHAIRGRLLAPRMLALHLPDVLGPPWGMLSTELRLLSFLAIACPLGAPLMQAQVGRLPSLPTPPPVADRPCSHDNAELRPPPPLAIACPLRAPVTLAPVAREGHHPLRHMLSTELGLPA